MRASGSGTSCPSGSPVSCMPPRPAGCASRLPGVAQRRVTPPGVRFLCNALNRGTIRILFCRKSNQPTIRCQELCSWLIQGLICKVAGRMIHGYSKTRTQVSDNQTQCFTLVPDYQHTYLFSPHNFTLTDDRRSPICSHSQPGSHHYQAEGRGGFDLCFLPKLWLRLLPLELMSEAGGKKSAPGRNRRGQAADRRLGPRRRLCSGGGA